jgi:branched-chain amino acid transport system substrate-binding protein
MNRRLETARRTTVLGVAVAMLGATLAACGGGSGGSGSGDSSSGLPDSIPVAAAIPRTGGFAATGADYERGVKIAVDTVNGSDELGGSKLDMQIVDTASTAATATSVISKFAQSDAVALLGLLTSPEALAAAPVAQQAKLPTIANCAPPGLIDTGEYIYSAATVLSSSIPLLTDYMVKTGDTSANIIYASDISSLVEYGKILATDLKKKGLTVDESIGVQNASTDFTAVATRAMRGTPDAIVLVSAGPSIQSIIQALRTAGYTGHIYGNPSAGNLFGSPAVTDGVVFPGTWIPAVENAENATFLDLYKKAYPDADPTYEAVDGYNSVYLLVEALKKAGKADRESVLKGLQDVTAEGIDGPSGKLTFVGEGKRQADTEGVLSVVKNGDFSIVTE